MIFALSGTIVWGSTLMRFGRVRRAHRAHRAHRSETRLYLICKSQCFWKVHRFRYVNYSVFCQGSSFMTICSRPPESTPHFTLVFTMPWESPFILWQYLQWIRRAVIANLILSLFLQAKTTFFAFYWPPNCWTNNNIYNKNVDLGLPTKPQNVARML